MKRHIKMPSISQFRQVVKNIKSSCKFFNEKLPVIKVTATEKIHGTNGSVCYSENDGFWVQSKEQIITPTKDNAGCAFYAEQNKNIWISIIKELSKQHNIDLNQNIITIYFEWCGKGIQKKTAVDGLEKMSIIFENFKVSPIIQDTENPEQSKWYSTNKIDSPENRIFNICNFPYYQFDIDFSNPLASQNKMIDIVENIIEPNSPVGKQFGIENNIGEGIVCTFQYKNNLHMFKLKGKKHSNSEVKTLKKVDDEKLQKIQDIAAIVTPGWRLEQMYNESNDILNGKTPDITNLGKFMKLLNCDIIKEESDIIAEAGLIPKEIFGSVGTIAREWYKEQLDKDVMFKN